MTTPPCLFAFVCTNQKTNKKCCADANAEAIYHYFKDEIKKKRPLINTNSKIKVVSTSCLGQCAKGPNIYIAPDDIWYTFSSKADIDELIDGHFIEGKRVERLVNRKIQDGE